MNKLRKISEKLAKRNDNVYFPGFGFEITALNSNEEEKIRYNRIVRACQKIANFKGMDNGEFVSTEDLAELLHYIADMADTDS